jgi:hypothetical protein
MRKLICKLFGHFWRYHFTPSDAHSKITDIRICKCCGKVQHHKQIASFNISGEWVWMNMIEYTKQGALKKWGDIK